MTSDHAPLDLAAASTGDHVPSTAGLTAPPTRAIAVLTCMDARVLPHRLLGLGVGEAHVMRNAGGRATPDAVRSLVVSTRLLGVRQVAVVHHSSCGNAGTDEELAAKLRDAGVEEPPAQLHGSVEPVAALREDVELLRATQGLAEGTTVEGWLYDLAEERLVPLAELEGA